MIEDEAIDHSLNSIVLDFVTYNGNYNTFTYSGFRFTNMAGGEITSGKFIVPLRLDIYYNVEDIVLAIIEIFVCLGFVGLFLDSLLKTAKDSLKFDKYEHGIEDLIGKKNTEIRNRIKPKWVRKLMTLFTVDRILRFIFCGLFIASFIIYVGIIVFSYNIKPSLRAGDVEYFEDLN